MKPSPRVLCAGIIVADHVCYPIDHLPAAGELVTTERMLLTIGGCAANTAVDLIKMGVPATVAGRVGGDTFGRVVADLLREHGVDVSGLKVSPGAETSQTLIVNVAGQDRRFIHCFGANADFQASDLPVDNLNQFAVLYVGGYLVMPSLRQEDLAAVFAQARKAGVKTVLDVVVPGPGDHLRQLEKLLPHVDVFLPNNHEAELLSGEYDPLQQAAFFHRLGAETVVITMGHDGSLLYQKDLRLRANVFPVPYVDASGGGDAFDAGFIYGLLYDMGPEACLRVASALGASCVRTIGTTPGVFTQVECEQFLRVNTLAIEHI
jgi:sugar/nucleoside kinase (ribokinase family)